MIDFIEGKPGSICRHAFGAERKDIGEIVLLIERDRTEQYKGAFDKTIAELKGGVFSGITGELNGAKVSVIYSKGPADIGDCVAFIALSKTDCRTIFSNGSIGGLETRFDAGDFFIVDEAAGNDGFSIFLSKVDGKENKGFFSNNIKPVGKIGDKIEESAKKISSSFGVSCHRGKIFTLPGVCFESKRFLEEIKQKGFAAVDMETAQFYAACNLFGFKSLAFHWITDLPLARNFIYKFEGDQKIVERDWKRKHPIWLNLAKINVEIIRKYISVSNKNE